MNTYADKKNDNKRQSMANEFSQKQSGGESTFRFVDNRHEATGQRKLQEMANNSLQVQQLRLYQEMANSSPQAKHAAELQAMADNNTTKQQPIIQRQENRTGLPDKLKAGIKNLSGYDMDDVRVHYKSDKPAQLHAHAFAKGTDIHVASGAEKHLSHEAWHVVQQKQGRVKPTMQMKDTVNINDDAGLDKEADVMGARAIQMHRADQESRNSHVMDATDFQQSPNAPIQMLRIYRRLSDGALIIELDVDEMGTYIHNGQILRRYRIEGGLILYVDPEDNRILSAEFDPWTPDDLAEALTQYSGDDNPPPDAPGGQVAAENTANIVFLLKPICACLVRGENATVRMFSAPVTDAGRPQVPHILMPRQRRRVDAALGDARDQLRAMAKVNYGVLYWLGTGATRMQEIINRLVAPAADAVHPLPDLRELIVQYVDRVRRGDAKDILGEDANAKLLKILKAALEAFDSYAQPKREDEAPRGLIDREFLQHRNINVLELGGIGLNPGVLDLNIDDSTNNSNMMVVGDAMDLPSQFAANAVDRVTAVLLPIVDMVGGTDTRTARRNAVARVLIGVNHVTGNTGTAMIQFNDNSGDAALTANDLKEIAGTLGFRVRDDSPGTPYRRFIFER